MLEALQQLITLNSVIILFMSLAVIALAAGVILLISPPLFYRLSVPMNRVVSARRALKAWEIPRSTEPFFYRHHRIFGILILVGVATYFGELSSLSRTELVNGIGPYLPGGIASWLVPGLLNFFIVANAFVLLVGLTILLRPSLLKGFESRVNRWVSTRRMTRRFVETNDAAESLVRRAPRLVGICVVLGSLYILASFALV